jgi:hypothetical protein
VRQIATGKPARPCRLDVMDVGSGKTREYKDLVWLNGYAIPRGTNVTG